MGVDTSEDCRSLTVAAVVVTLQKEEDTVACLTSLLESSLRPNRILLIDNGSQDGSIDRLARRFADRPAVEVHRNERNVGYAAAANQGIRRALDGTDAILLMNDDAELPATALEELAGGLIRHPEAGVAVPRIVLASDPETTWRGPSRFSWFKAGAVDPERGRSEGRRSDGDRWVEMATGCVALARTDTFRRVGLFDERFFLYGEDTDFLFRVQRAGMRILFASRAVALHRVPEAEIRPRSSFSALHMARSHVLVIRKHARGLLRIYAIAVHFLVHTPCVIVRVMRRSGLRTAVGWLRGSIEGLRARIGDGEAGSGSE
jgi:GT2 family glycosyltransferase